MKDAKDKEFNIENTQWTQAKDLVAGDVALSANGARLQIVSIEIDDRSETVYNFEVEDFHTYFVGEVGVWVHNAEYIVKKGEKVSTIADKFGISKEALLTANPKAKDRGYFLAGEEINVPGSGSQVDGSQTATQYLNAGNAQLKKIKELFSSLNPFSEKVKPAFGQAEVLPNGNIVPIPLSQERYSICANGGDCERTLHYQNHDGNYEDMYHGGLDLHAPFGTPIPVAVGGTIVNVNDGFSDQVRGSGAGNNVIIRDKDGINHLYAHLKKDSIPSYLKIGVTVKPNEIIGELGNSGNSYGAHLHYELTQNGRNINPITSEKNSFKKCEMNKKNKCKPD